MTKIKVEREKVFFSILIVFYTIGLIGMYIPSLRTQILPLSSLNLYLTFVILVLAAQQKKTNFFAGFICIYVLAMLSEWIGVHTHFLYGNYKYGPNLGLKIFEVPFVIGINWFILVVGTSSLLASFKWHVWTKIIIGAMLMTIFDWILEPIAVQNGYWSWHENQIPIFNYISWFFVSLLGHWIYYQFKLNQKNNTHTSILLIMTLFFILLHLKK